MFVAILAVIMLILGSLLGVDAFVCSAKAETVYQQQIVYLQYILAAVLVGSSAIVFALLPGMRKIERDEKIREDALRGETKKTTAP